MANNPMPRIVNLHGSLTVERASQLRDELAAALESADQAFISLSLVEELDLACLQVFYSARKTARAAGKQVHFVGSVPSRVVRRLAASGYLRGAPERAEEFEAALVDF
jgi:anti-anti-sigma regulatory factor